MKTKLILITITMLSFLFSGCNKDENGLGLNVKFLHAYIQYVDENGNRLIKEPNSEALAKNSPLEILSVTNEYGDSIEFISSRTTAYSKPCIHIDKGFLYQALPKERKYIIKYKIPSILGETIEELRMTYNTDSDSYTDISYNGNKNIRVITYESIFPDSKNPEFSMGLDEFDRIINNLISTGDPVAYLINTDIYLYLQTVQ